MKTSITINLGGFAFIIDNDAFNRLRAYLDLLEKHFRNDNEKKEIIEDIEIRIAELLREKIHQREVVNINDIEEVINIMGDPEQIGTSEDEPENTRSSSRSKRIYRDPENRIIGGVCGGLGAYFDFDPIILRVLFALAFLFAGFGILVYVILWIVILEAKTTAQKLEMRGEKVNFSNIGDKVKEEFNNVKRNMNFNIL